MSVNWWWVLFVVDAIGWMKVINYYGISFTKTLIIYDSIGEFFVVKNLVTTLKAILLIYKSQHHQHKSTSVQCSNNNMNAFVSLSQYNQTVNFQSQFCVLIGFDRRLFVGRCRWFPPWRRTHHQRPQRHNHPTRAHWTHRPCPRRWGIPRWRRLPPRPRPCPRPLLRGARPRPPPPGGLRRHRPPWCRGERTQDRPGYSVWTIW